MSWEEEKERARKLLGQSALSHVAQLLWHSAILTALLLLGDFIFRLRAFDVENAGETFIIATGSVAFMKFMTMLLAAGKLRKPVRKSEDDDPT